MAVEKKAKILLFIIAFSKKVEKGPLKLIS